MAERERIFVQIASYRDPDCQWTIKDLYDYAADPDRVFVGVCWQFVPELDQDCFAVKTRPEQVRTVEFDARESRGVCWARHQTQKLWRGEEFTLQIDSHMRFEPGWDETLIEMCRGLSGKPVLSAFPPGFLPPRKILHRGTVAKIVAKEFDPNGILTFGSIIHPDAEPPKAPMPSAFIAAGFLFAPSSVIADVAYDPFLYFTGEEISLAARLWTHGYDFYAPYRAVIYHNYERKGRSLHWEDASQWMRLNDRSTARVRHLLGTQRSRDPWVLEQMDAYGLGNARSLHDYELFAGVSFKHKTISEKAKSYYFPYTSSADARAGAGAPATEAEVARLSAKARLSFTLTTKFKGPGVPAQLVEGSGGQVERRTVQRELLAIATELMFGAEPEGLIARLIAFGAPAKEARRIIETADTDPLIANGRAMALVLRKRDWLLGAQERQQRLWPGAAQIERRSGIGAEAFLEHYYSRGRPVILTGAMTGWPALEKWAPDYLAAVGRGVDVSCQAEAPQAGRTGPDAYLRSMAFDAFVRRAVRAEAGDGVYVVADAERQNTAAAARLRSDLGTLDALLDAGAPQSGGIIWLGSSGVLTPLHHDLVNCLIAQVVGRSRFKIIAAADVAKLYNYQHVLSEISDLESPDFGPARFPALKSVEIHDVTLEPGEVLFVPLAWWYQVRSVGFGASVTFTNFRWPNDAYRTYPRL